MTDDRKLAEDWWTTAIIKMRPGTIRLRGYAIEDLIGNVSFVEMVWLMLRAELPSPAQAKLLEMAMVAGVDHGPQAPSIAVARMAMTSGVGINGAMASAINILDDVHGGAGEQAVEFYNGIAAQADRKGLETAIANAIAMREADGDKYVPGFGHRFHPVDPRAPRILELVRQAVVDGTVEGKYLAVAEALSAHLASTKSHPIPMNIDGATAVVYAELGFVPALCRGLFVLSRSVGILSHAYEESLSGKRNKGPIPRQWLWTYDGPQDRQLSAHQEGGENTQ
jgi:citrate synthase